MRAIDRRRFFAAVSCASLTSVVPKAFAIEPPLETTKIRLAQISGICIAPQYVGEALLKLEGFTDVRYVPVMANSFAAVASGQADVSMAFVAPLIVQADAGMPIVLLGGIHTGCFELFGAASVYSTSSNAS
jgi:NitT/TauT family transport system substrate-binding protein